MTQVSQISKMIGERLRKIRLEKALSPSVARQVRIAYGVRLDSRYLLRMERGKTEIPLRTLFALADFYEVEVAEIVKGIAWQ